MTPNEIKARCKKCCDRGEIVSADAYVVGGVTIDPPEYAPCDCPKGQKLINEFLSNANENIEEGEGMKKPVIFYWEEAVDAWIPVPEKVEHIINLDNMEPGETFDITFKCVLMSDEEMANLPVV
jgi:hypothetical protein